MNYSFVIIRSKYLIYKENYIWGKLICDERLSWKMYWYSTWDLLLIFNWIYIIMAEKSGTTPHIKHIFIGRCWQYQRNKPVNINCTELWTAFNDSFAFRNSCNVKSENYKRFFNILEKDANTTLPNAMFYSGSYNLVNQFTHINDDYVVLEETLTGFVLNELKWCGSTSSHDGLNYTHCDTSEPCNAVKLAWKIASARFARRAVGTAHTILNASRSHGNQAYYEKSFFRMYEMPELRVKRLVVFLASNIGTTLRERCGEKSLLELLDDANKKNITMECVDQPELVFRIFCLKFPKKSDCKRSKEEEVKSNKDKPRKWRILGITFSVISVILLLGVGAWIVHHCHSRKGHNYSVHQERNQPEKVNNHVKDSTGHSSEQQSNGILLA